MLCGDRRRCPKELGAYMNHSITPNCRVVMQVTKKCQYVVPVFFMETLKDLLPNTPLTWNYGSDKNQEIACFYLSDN